jgi:raffinose/stachyose/melibiose transport system permease protein
MQLLSGSRAPAPALEAPHPRTGKRRSNRFALLSTVAICLLPALILYLVFVLLPVVQAAYYSFYRWNGLDPLENFVGLNNYLRIITTDRVFLKAVTNNVTIVALSLLMQLQISLV